MVALLSKNLAGITCTFPKTSHFFSLEKNNQSQPREGRVGNPRIQWKIKLKKETDTMGVGHWFLVAKSQSVSQKKQLHRGGLQVTIKKKYFQQGNDGNYGFGGMVEEPQESFWVLSLQFTSLLGPGLVIKMKIK